MNTSFVKLTVPTPEIVAAFNQWENDPDLIPFIRPNPTKDDLEKRESVNAEVLSNRLDHNEIYLIYAQGRLVGEMDYQIDPNHLYKIESGTAWIGINLGEKNARGKGIGTLAIEYLEEQIKARGFQRIELGVFEFNTNALKLYQKMGYREIGRIKDFTFWRNRLWQDIRMEKYLI